MCIYIGRLQMHILFGGFPCILTSVMGCVNSKCMHMHNFLVFFCLKLNDWAKYPNI